MLLPVLRAPVLLSARLLLVLLPMLRAQGLVCVQLPLLVSVSVLLPQIPFFRCGGKTSLPALRLSGLPS